MADEVSYTKAQILDMIKEEYDSWEKLLGSLSEEEITANTLPDNWSIKDVMAHLMVWQKRTVAKLEAAISDTEPVFPPWSKDADPDTDEELQNFNDWAYKTNEDRAWDDVYSDWKTGYLRYIELSKAVRESDLLAVGKYIWLEEYPLGAYVTGSYEHHQEHLDNLQSQIDKHKTS